jgi:hypothetical protein
VCYEYARTTGNQWRWILGSFDKCCCRRFEWENNFLCLIIKGDCMKDLTANEKEHINGGMIIEPVGLKFIQIVLDMLK